MVNQRQLNGGQQGAGSGLDADKVDGNEASGLGGGIEGETGNERIEYGTVSMGSSVSFDTAFSSTPVITNAPESGASNQTDDQYTAHFQDGEPSSTGFTAYGVRQYGNWDNGDTVEDDGIMHWIAIGE